MSRFLSSLSGSGPTAGAANRFLSLIGSGATAGNVNPTHPPPTDDAAPLPDDGFVPGDIVPPTHGNPLVATAHAAPTRVDAATLPDDAPNKFEITWEPWTSLTQYQKANILLGDIPNLFPPGTIALVKSSLAKPGPHDNLLLNDGPLGKLVLRVWDPERRKEIFYTPVHKISADDFTPTANGDVLFSGRKLVDGWTADTFLVDSSIYLQKTEWSTPSMSPGVLWEGFVGRFTIPTEVRVLKKLFGMQYKEVAAVKKPARAPSSDIGSGNNQGNSSDGFSVGDKVKITKQHGNHYGKTGKVYKKSNKKYKVKLDDGTIFPPGDHLMRGTSIAKL